MAPTLPAASLTRKRILFVPTGRVTLVLKLVTPLTNVVEATVQVLPALIDTDTVSAVAAPVPSAIGAAKEPEMVWAAVMVMKSLL